MTCARVLDSSSLRKKMVINPIVEVDIPMIRIPVLKVGWPWWIWRSLGSWPWHPWYSPILKKFKRCKCMGIFSHELTPVVSCLGIGNTLILGNRSWWLRDSFFFLNFSRSSYLEPSADNLITDYFAFVLADKHTHKQYKVSVWRGKLF